MDRDPGEQTESKRSLESRAPTPEQDRSSESADRSRETPKVAPEPQSSSPPPAEVSLPESYGETNLVAVPVNPFVVHCQWEVAPADIEKARQALGVGHQEFWPVLRIQDVGGAAPEGASPSGSFDVEVQLQAGNWYVRSCAPDRAYRADLALKSEDGSFVVVASSNAAHTPPATPSTHADECWAPIRLDPRPPQNAVSPTFPVGLQNELSSSGEQDMAKPAGSLPIDMREEVRSTLAALFGDRGREEPKPLLLNQFAVPIDLRNEFPGELADLHLEQQYEQSEPGRAMVAAAAFVSKSSAAESDPRKPAASAARNSGELFDLTSLNERSFSPGTTSRTK